MKTKTGKLILLILGGMILLFIIRSPYYDKESTMVESVLIDQTDTFLAIPNVGEVFAPLHIEENKWKSIDLRIQTISNFDYNTVSSLHLEPRLIILSNPAERDHEIEFFKHKSDSVIENIKHEEYGKTKSSIYRIIISEANRLSVINAKIKSIIVYSDLLENSSIFSIYNADSRALLKSDPDQVKKLFEQVIRPGNLQGISVHFIFKPKSDMDNEYFLLTSTLFKSILEGAGAKVSIGANLIEN